MAAMELKEVGAGQPMPVNGHVDTLPITRKLDPVQRFVFDHVSWQEFEAFCRALPERHFRLAYDGQRLEIMAVSEFHSHLGGLIAQVVQILSDELDVPRRTSGDFTLKRDGVERGIQADECFYLENEPKVRNQREIDLERDPPPDLGIEVEVTATVISRLPLYAKLRIPEVWRFDGERIEVLQLQSDGQYTVVPRSRYFPQVPLAEVVKFLKENLHLGEAQMFRAFRAWVRDQIARGWPNDS